MNADAVNYKKGWKLFQNTALTVFVNTILPYETFLWVNTEKFALQPNIFCSIYFVKMSWSNTILNILSQFRFIMLYVIS